MPANNDSPVSITETKIVRPLLRPLDFLRCFKYGCTWLFLAMIFALRAGYIGDFSEIVHPGSVAATIVCGLTSLVVCIVIVSNDGRFTPDLD